MADTVNVGTSRLREREPLLAGAPQEPAGSTEETFPLGKHARGGGLAPQWETGGPQGFFSRLVANLRMGTHPLLETG